MTLRLVTTLLLSSIVFMLTFGLMTSMRTDDMGQMSPCPFSMASSICTMSFSEHLSLWQSMFTATLDSGTLLLIVGLIVLAFSIAFKHLDTSQDQELKSYRFYTHQHSKNSTFNKLLDLFSQGILNPKIYSLATL